MLWGLTGTPCLDDFANVAKLVRACSDIDLLVFRRQLDAKDLVTWKNVLADLLMECGPISGKCESILAIFARCLMSFVPKQLSFACYVLHGVIVWKAIAFQAQRTLDYLARANGDLKGLEASKFQTI